MRLLALLVILALTGAPHPAFGHLLPAGGEKDNKSSVSRESRSLPLAPQRGERVASGRVRGRTVTLDVKDAEVHNVLRSMQKQCGVKNLVIDPGVSGSATFYFRNVPCETAFRTVLRTYGLAAQIDIPTMITVGARSN